jgi:hypothetical protein
MGLAMSLHMHLFLNKLLLYHRLDDEVDSQIKDLSLFSNTPKVWTLTLQLVTECQGLRKRLLDEAACMLIEKKL